MLLRDSIEDSVREKRKYDKSGAFSKKKRTYVTEGEFKNIVMSLKRSLTLVYITNHLTKDQCLSLKSI